MSSEKILAQALQTIESNGSNSGGFSLTKLAGDASLRRYYRIRNSAASYIVMVTAPFDPAKFEFLQVQKHLLARNVPVPLIYAMVPEQGGLLLEDLGDKTMLHVLGDSPGNEKIYFQRALDLLVDFHSRTNDANPQVVGYSLAFDVEKLLWEVDFTLEHLFGSYLKKQPPAEQRDEIRKNFELICQILAAEPRVFTHRDYHSRNIMLTAQDRLVCIDFQDARMGTHVYDLASILRDSYYQLTEEQIYTGMDYYFSKMKKEDIRLNDQQHFKKIFDLMSVQRNFKAIGSFASFYGKRGDPSYLRYIGTSFENIRRNLSKYPEFHRLRKLLVQNYYY